jgi:glycosyltransferase involved in cell wall biosynthesis
LKVSIKSILDQTFKDFELLILDDGSKICAEDIVLSFKDNRIKYVRGENVGLANNINRSIGLLKGKYIARLDQDDVSEPERLKKQLELFHNIPEVDCVFSYIKRFGSKKSWTEKTLNNVQKFHKFEPFTDGCMVHSTMMVKKEVLIALNGYRQEYYPADDWDLELRMCHRYNIYILEDELVNYRIHDGANTFKNYSLMQNTRRWAEENYFRRQKNMKEISFKEYFKNKSLADKLRHWRKDNAKLNVRIAGNYYLKNKKSVAFFYILKAFIFHPNTILKRFKFMFAKQK